ncbi:YkgJ family cysteine cluster protein [Candidatus Bathyarchaeota archaeon]|nr:YkgJ family cysteine cluster protein [Candidatus Bathyarchaeota archaeon]
MQKFSKYWRCLSCGECCKNLVGKKFGAAVTGREKQRLEILASRRAVNMHLVPLASNGFSVTLWQFAESVCPFLDKATNQCKIYEWRPALCRAFPLMPSGLGECESLRQDSNRYKIMWPPGQLAHGKAYFTTVLPLLRSARKVYNLNLGRWEANVRQV